METRGEAAPVHMPMIRPLCLQLIASGFYRIGPDRVKARRSILSGP